MDRMLKLKKVKKDQMKELTAYKKKLWETPQLRNLFLEVTRSCNENCLHCGSNCSGEKQVELTKEQYVKFLDEIARDFKPKEIMLCVTGGEPLLRKDLFDLMSYATHLGFAWGMTTNGTLIDKIVAERLFKSGLKTIAISIDGLEETHDAFRGRKGAYSKAMEGIQNLIHQGGLEHIQITTVVHKKNIQELEAYMIF